MDGEPLGIPVVRCHCVPPNTVFFMQENPCRWPKCPNGERPDPAKDDDE